MSNNELDINQMKNMLKNMGMDLDNLPTDKLQEIINLTQQIKDPQNMSTEYKKKLQELLKIKKEPRKKTKIGVNQKCPCGSSLKYKKCCGKYKKLSK